MNEPTSTSNLEYQALHKRTLSKGSYRWFAILCIIALLIASRHGNVQVHQVSHDPHFEFLMFSQLSPAGYCITHGHCLKNKTRQFFTIHGLWPSSASSSPENCKPAAKFDPHILEALRVQLEEFWTSTIKQNSQSFWRHEWYKHGSCATAIPELSGVLNYFNRTLELYKLHNITKFFSDSGIEQSETETYPTSTILDILRQHVRSQANIVCRKVEGFAYPILTEVRYCLSNDSLKTIDCKSKHEQCGDGGIYYLPVETLLKTRIGGWSGLLMNWVSFYLNYLSPV